MPRQSRLDAPGTLHHVIGRGIERQPVFRTDADRDDFLRRIEEVAAGGHLDVLAWALIPNHFHLLVRTGTLPLATAMRRLLTGYAVVFNKRYNRHGHLFQNRYKSIVCEEEPYLLELVRYIHLNPLRAGVVPDLGRLDHYPYAGHCALLGHGLRGWQATDEILDRFGTTKAAARREYRDFVLAGLNQGARPDLVGGGLIRSAGGWSEVLAMRQRKERVAADQRILGSGAFVEAMLNRAQEEEVIPLQRSNQERRGLAELAARVCAVSGVAEAELRNGGRRRSVLAARRALIQVAVRGEGYAGAEVARYLGVSTSCVTRQVAEERTDPLVERLGSALET